ncbi:hypothetical protein I4U23_014789 [Adineta vaga]|nr:hypothetical protein I4U23_014789 [Adineta vaga]
MVDVIEFLPPISGLFNKNIHQKDTKQVILPIILTTVKNLPSNDRVNNFQNTTQWIARCPSDTLRQINTSHVAYDIHRKTISHELSQFYPADTTDKFSMVKIKQQQQPTNDTKDSLKVTVGTTTTTVTSLPNVSSVDTRSTRLFNTLSKHVTIKTEPLRQTNYLLNNSKKTSSSWQKYWTSRFTQRRRRESIDSDFASYRSKRDREPLLATTDLVPIQDSITDTNVDEKSPTLSSCSTPSKFPSPIVSDDEPSFINEENHLNLPAIISSREKLPKMDRLKSSEEKIFTPVQSKPSIIENKKPISVKTKLYKLPLPSNKAQIDKPLIKRKPQNKFIEPSTTPVSSNTKEQTSSNKPHRTTTTTIKNQNPLSTMITTTPRSKYEQISWEEPYVGVRFDPPTPPCSPFLYVWPQDHDQEHKEI